MKREYRVKLYLSDKNEHLFVPQVKRFLFWRPLMGTMGSTSLDDAKNIIDRHATHGGDPRIVYHCIYSDESSIS